VLLGSPKIQWLLQIFTLCKFCVQGGSDWCDCKEDGGPRSVGREMDADIIDETENTGNLAIIPNGVIPISFSVWITAGLGASGAMCKDSGPPACQ